MGRSRPLRLAVVASHPIPYFTPLYRRLAERKGIDLVVFFCGDFGVRPHFDKQFGREVRWDTDLLGGYPHRFLRSISPISDPFSPFHAINPGAFVQMLRPFDAVWVNGYLYPSNWLASAAAGLRGARVLFRCDMRPRREEPVRWHHGLRDRLLRHWVRRADALLYIGEENRRAYLQHGAREEQLFFTPFSVDVDRFEAGSPRDDAARRALRRKNRIPEDAIVVVFVGKLTERKQPQLVLRLCREFRAQGLHGVIAGSGPLEAQLRAEVVENGLQQSVSFLGFVNQQALPEVYGLGDLFVFPSRDEPWGLVLNEAMAAGLAPLVSDDVGSAPDLITPGVTGMLFRTDDPESIVAAAAQLVASPEERRRVGAAARERARLYSYDATVQGIVDALDAVISRPGLREGGR